MAIVQTYKCSNGATVHIHDDAYVGVPVEEIRRRQQEFINTAKELFIKNEIRRIQQEQEAAQAKSD